MNEKELLHRRLFESRSQNKAMRALLREQKDRSRKLIAAFAGKLQEKESQIDQIKCQREDELSYLAQEMTFLRSNVLKEQKHLKDLVQCQDAEISKLEMELEKCRKHHIVKSKLVSKSKLLSSVDNDRDMDTPSSEDSSPKSSFSKGPKIEIKPRIQKIPENHVISSSPHRSASTAPEKPPVPSRAGVNRKLMAKQPPPLPPARSSSITSKSRRSHNEERQDSGRDSDGFGTDLDRSSSFNAGEIGDSLNLSRLSIATSEENMDQLSPAHSRISGDEGFCSSYEDKAPPPPPPRSSAAPNTPRQVVNNHRDVQKPSDIKHRSKLKSSSNLGVLEEHQVTADPRVATVSYWTEPYL